MERRKKEYQSHVMGTMHDTSGLFFFVVCSYDWALSLRMPSSVSPVFIDTQVMGRVSINLGPSLFSAPGFLKSSPVSVASPVPRVHLIRTQLFCSAADMFLGDQWKAAVWGFRRSSSNPAWLISR